MTQYETRNVSYKLLLHQNYKQLTVDFSNTCITAFFLVYQTQCMVHHLLQQLLVEQLKLFLIHPENLISCLQLVEVVHQSQGQKMPDELFDLLLCVHNLKQRLYPYLYNVQKGFYQESNQLTQRINLEASRSIFLNPEIAQIPRLKVTNLDLLP
jgi:hypothetical protein